MPLSADIKKAVQSTFRDVWQVVSTTTVPNAVDVKLGSNDAKFLESATVLYADIDGSTNLVDTYSWFFAAECYKAFLMCAAWLIKDEGGVVTAYDGDRVMGIFTNSANKNTSAVRAALRLAGAVDDVIAPACKSIYSVSTDFKLKHVVGIDTSPLHAARTGVRGDNDLVWVGAAANYAAKLSDLSEDGYRTYVSAEVYSQLHDSVLLNASRGNVWERRIWNATGKTIYRSNARWSIP